MSHERMIFLLQHFSFKPLYENNQLPGWSITFFHKQQRYAGEYEPDGTIKWVGSTPPDEEIVKKMIHELMLFHVYD